MKPEFHDLDTFVEDLSGVVEDTLVSFGFERQTARIMVVQYMQQCFRNAMKDYMVKSNTEEIHR